MLSFQTVLDLNEIALISYVIKNGSKEGISLIFLNPRFFKIFGSLSVFNLGRKISMFLSNNEKFNVKFKEILIYDTEKFYTLAYSNDPDDFDSQLQRFEESIESFEIFFQVFPKLII